MNTAEPNNIEQTRFCFSIVDVYTSINYSIDRELWWHITICWKFLWAILLTKTKDLIIISEKSITCLSLTMTHKLHSSHLIPEQYTLNIQQYDISSTITGSIVFLKAETL